MTTSTVKHAQGRLSLGNIRDTALPIPAVQLSLSLSRAMHGDSVADMCFGVATSYYASSLFHTRYVDIGS